MRIAVALLTILVLLTGAVPAVATVQTDAGTDPSAASFASIDEPVLTEIHIVPKPGGDARWTVSIRYNISTETDRAAFQRYGRQFEADETDTGLDVGFFRTLASESSQSTGREMSIQNPNRNATIRNGTGVLSLSFTWTNFVTDTESGFEIQDSVLMPNDRTWLSSLGPSQRLVVETPPGYQVTDTRFGLHNGSVVIDGPHTFTEPLSISYQQTATEEPASTPWALIGGALFAGLGLVATVLYVRRRRVEEAEPSATAGRESATEAPPSEDADAGESETGAEVAAGGAAAAATETGEQTAESETDDVDPELLSDEERIEYLLEQSGGRMKQGQIVRETGWSDAKVSQLLSTMADEGRIEKLRLGRENLISLPEDDADA